MFQSLIVGSIVLAGFAIEEEPAPKLAVQILFTGSEGATVASKEARSCRIPARLNLDEGCIHRLKLSGIPGHDKLELNPTLEIGPLTPRTETYTADRAVGVSLTKEEIAYVASGKFLTKVTYLPDPENLDAKGNLEKVISSADLAAGRDPIIEADRAGTILAVLRLSPPPK